jgi:arylsulfatase A-like enzyme
VVYSLLDNRLLAHLSLRGGLFVPGDHSLAKYLHRHRLANRRTPAGNWNLEPGAAARGVAPTDRSTQLTVPLSAAQAQARVISLRIRSTRPAVITIRVGWGHARGSARLRGGWQHVRLKLGPKAFRPGDNQLTIDWGSVDPGRRLAWLHIGPREPQPPLQAPRFEKGQLVLPRNGAASWVVTPPSRSTLDLQLKRGAGEGACALGLTLEGSRPVISGPPGSRRGPQRRVPLLDGARRRLSLPLGRFTERPLRISLAAVGRRCPGVVVQAARLTVPVAPTLKDKASRKPKNVLLWVVDTARADHYRLYAPSSRVETPLLSKLALRGVVFENAYSTGGESQAGYGALWTGAHPAQNGELALAKRRGIPRRWATLPKALKRSGRITGCFTANGFVAKHAGYARGCDQFHNAIHDGGSTRTEALVQRAIRFVRARGAKPFFLYVGTIDPHVSLYAREPWLSRYHPKPYRGPFKHALYGLVAARFVEAVYDRPAGTKVFEEPVAARHRERIIAIYDSTISHNDAQLARLWRALERAGVAKDTLLVVTADHGEELWDDGGFGHGHNLRDYVTRVPLLLHHPASLAKGARVRAAVSGVDVMPTILGALGLTAPDHAQGADLRPLVAAPTAPRGAVSTRFAAEWSLRLSNFKLLVSSSDATLYRLHGMVEQPSNNALARRWLRDALNTFITYQGRWRQRRWGAPGNHRGQLPLDLERGSAPDPLRKPPKPPKPPKAPTSPKPHG